MLKLPTQFDCPVLMAKLGQAWVGHAAMIVREWNFSIVAQVSIRWLQDASEASAASFTPSRESQGRR